jgi:glycine dehydrogenase
MAAAPFVDRHLGTDPADRSKMLAALGYGSLDELLDAAVPASIRDRSPLRLPEARTETDTLEQLRTYAGRNRVVRSLIGQGYSGTITPAVIQRNVLENPAWYTAYTPYQPEISQGRLEALLNFQTMVADLTGMDLANASMLDEATAAAEAMTMGRRISRIDADVIVVDADTHPQTIEVLRTRAEPLGITVEVRELDEMIQADAFAALLSYPGSSGEVRDLGSAAAALSDRGVFVIVAADLLALTLFEAPGQWPIDAVVGSAQRFGVPMGYGGPHAGFLATREAHKRTLPGRLVGVSVDTAGRTAYRLALQTREQHIRREKATSNICTAQVLLAVIAAMYATYHGPEGLTSIAAEIRRLTGRLCRGLVAAGLVVRNEAYFDTVTVEVPDADVVMAAALERGYNLRRVDNHTVGVSLDETCDESVVSDLLDVFGATDVEGQDDPVPADLARRSPFLTHPTFHRYRSETEMLRYLRRLADRDLALDRTMIPLGSCTMKLNATTEMIPITWPEFASLHPFVPADQAAGYAALFEDLEAWLAEITGYDAISLQPNAGSQGEYAGLLAIRAYHADRGDAHRDLCLIPASAHGTNAASAVMAGMRVAVVACDDAGNVDFGHLTSLLEERRDEIAALMITYPSTHGVFEEHLVDICDRVHAAGGQVYLDGANMNALVGVARPGRLGADVGHLNLHKTFCIPHGGGGPGVGPIGVRAHLAPYLPGRGIGPVAAAPWGSASILPISWAYIAMMGPDGLRDATATAILAANYVAHRLGPHYPVLYTGQGGLVAHECILDIRPIEKATGVNAEDIAKRLIDYGFHAPTMSFPVAGTLMVEPTESESLTELDRFCDAMIQIRAEIEEISSGRWSVEDSPLRHAPHPAADVVTDGWNRAYPREVGAFPTGVNPATKYWPPVSRIDNGYGDRNLMCSCPSVEDLAEP